MSTNIFSKKYERNFAALAQRIIKAVHEVLSKADFQGYAKLTIEFHNELDRISNSLAVRDGRLVFVDLLGLQNQICGIFNEIPELAKLAESFDLPPPETNQVIN